MKMQVRILSGRLPARITALRPVLIRENEVRILGGELRRIGGMVNAAACKADVQEFDSLIRFHSIC
jgi:hypothetical protein